jgi:hypothetical protein
MHRLQPCSADSRRVDRSPSPHHASSLVGNALSRPRAQQAWEDANRTAHELLHQVLEGGGPIVATTGGVVVIDLKQLLDELQARTGVGGRASAHRVVTAQSRS